MKRLSDFVIKQSNNLLENKQHAILYAVVLSMLPFTSWLSVALVALLTLRKGARPGFEVLLPAIVFHSVPLMLMVPLDSVFINTVITYIPCYLAAIVLRNAMNWQAVFGVLFLQVVIACSLVQILIPNFIMEQFSQFQNILAQHDEYMQLMTLSTDGLKSFNLAQLFFGIQIFSVIMFTVISLMCARSVQARIFMPGGFREEFLAFRSGRLSFLVLATVSLTAYYEFPLAINLLPFILSYFVLSGFSLVYRIVDRKRQLKIVVLLFLFILMKPVFMLLALIVFGSLDSLFNFRLYLPKRVREST